MMGLPVAISSVYMVSVVRHKFKLGEFDIVLYSF